VIKWGPQSGTGNISYPDGRWPDKRLSTEFCGPKKKTVLFAFFVPVGKLRRPVLAGVDATSYRAWRRHRIVEIERGIGWSTS
jgi:hypothetical protein